MRTPTRGFLAASMVVAATTLAGCSAPLVPAWTNSPDPVVEPVFASNDEALAAAITSYEAYATMSNQITNEGGADSERITEYVSSGYRAEVIAAFAKLEESGRIGSGASTIDTVSLVRYHDVAVGSASVRAYMCVDVTDVLMRDEEGAVTTTASRPNRIPLQVSFVSGPRESTRLIVEKEDLWSGTDFC
ncbi:hypothetical protein [Cryobacterium psychrophilum]|uniref:Lipoprotein n=1 Tax=Cryobacterium psychrophilum TaxID=41988 RepID=A0A4Y8KK34_9MICO|nr:hypothetical protein [Cryobacterium psychrophilum]TFD76604.1 hypothetical protein E3T53_13165 [Cryobacterium psychrophilum]